jgi:hypothetical protein
MAAEQLGGLTHDDLRGLLVERKGPAVSIFLPTERVAVAAEQNSVRLKNLIGRASERLAARRLRKTDACALLAPLKGLISDATFWRRRLDGLAVFRTPDLFAAHRLPFATDELVVVGEHLHTKPLLPALIEGHYYVLALSQGAVRLLRATRYGVEEIDLQGLGIPQNLAEALRYDDLQKPELQHHPTMPPGGRAEAGPASAGRGGGRRRHAFHGHGEGGEDLKVEILRYFHGVDAGISRLLAGERAPLVLAGVDFLHPLYRQASSYQFILERGLEGNPEQLSAAQLHERTLPLVEEHFRAPLQAARARYGNAVGTGLTSSDLPEVLVGAHGGRVDSLWLRRGEESWGRFDAASGAVATSPEQADEDLFDLAARQTILHRGHVWLVDPEDMPAAEGCAALFRY